ncbi:hypothetical protein GCM10007385_10510 [Tateyamaria omphalii]|uniref:prepilin peptidase n=1 Tax=Tateyamaria omphalii TaxID=299262 RepID=UPI001673465F|nr:A24 family peptidase [Tateyamaria omphalii]GGX44463.1 hypothetical protein GCM10007385_10510 [Tateyamaria omphalii]
MAVYASGLALLGPWPGIWLVWAVSAGFIWVSIVDFRQFEIPDLATIGLICAALFWIATDPRVPWQAHIAGAVFWPIGFEAIRRMFLWRSGFDGLGFGDVKLMVPLALFCGPVATANMVLFATLSALGLMLTLAALRRQPITHLAMPFGPFLCFSTWITWVSGL